jgi:hypothetical protein
MKTKSKHPGIHSESRATADDAVQNDPFFYFPDSSGLLSPEEGEKLFRELYPKDDIYTYVLLQGREIEVYEYLDAHLDRSTPVNAIALLVAARKVGIVGGLNYRVATRIFGKFCGKSVFNSYYNEKGGRDIEQSVVDNYETALRRQFSLQ